MPSLYFALCSILLWSLPATAQVSTIDDTASWHKDRRYLNIIDSTTTFLPKPFQWNGVQYHHIFNTRSRAVIGGRVAKRWALVFGAQHDWAQMNASTQQDTFHQLNGRLVAIYLHSKTWRGVGFARLGMGSTNGQWNPKRPNIAAGLSAQWVASRWTTLNFGLLYTNQFHLRVLPLLGIKYKKHRWLVDFIIPQGGGAWYALSPMLQLGAVLRIHNLRYHEARSPNFLTQTNYFTGASMRWFLWRGLNLTAEGGLSPRQSRIKTNKTDAASFTPDSLFFSLRLAYSI